MTPKRPEIFDFDIVRVVCRLRIPEGIEIVAPSIYDLLFEVQIRTALEHAWAVAMHPIIYKSDRIEWRRRRLASQIKAGLENLDNVILAFDKIAEAMNDLPWARIESEKKVHQFLEKLLASGLIMSEYRPKDMTRFCANFLEILPWSHREAHLEELLRRLEDKIRTYEVNQIPRSFSLLQFLTCLLHEMRLLRTDGEFHFHITSEMITFFPNIGQLRSFTYE